MRGGIEMKNTTYLVLAVLIILGAQLFSLPTSEGAIPLSRGRIRADYGKHRTRPVIGIKRRVGFFWGTVSRAGSEVLSYL